MSFVRSIAALGVIFLAVYRAGLPAYAGEDWQPVGATTVEHGDLKVVFRDIRDSPAVLSGADALFHVRHAPRFDAFDPDSPGASAGSLSI